MAIYELQKNGLTVLQSSLFENSFAHGFSTRFGGVSKGAFSSLNMEFGRGDATENVLENHRRFGEVVGFAPDGAVLTKQVHETTIRTVGRADRGTGIFTPQDNPCDGLITNEPGVALTVFGADCCTVLLGDAVQKVVCAVHAGWRGTARGMVRLAAEKMQKDYLCKPENIVCALGPSIKGCCFTTHRDVPDALLASLGECVLPYIRETEQDLYHVDLPGINRLLLSSCGIKNIDVCPDCTCCHPDKYWSHRKVGAARGAQIAVIMLRE